MTEVEPRKPALSYATPASPATQQSRYAAASLAVSAVSVLWFALAIFGAPLPVDAYKQHRIGTVTSVLALILSIAAYWQPNRKRTTAHAAITVAAIVLLAYFLVVPL